MYRRTAAWTSTHSFFNKQVFEIRPFAGKKKIMASSHLQLRIPTLAIAALSLGLNIAIIACAGRTLNIYLTQRHDNVYFLPVWTSHFDMRGLPALLGTSAVIVVLNALLIAAIFISALPANLLVFASSLLSTILAIIAVAFPATVNNGSESDTLQTWTCMWRHVEDENVPRQFDTLCHETRFAFYTTIPSLMLQLMLLALAVYVIAFASKTKRGVRLDEEEEKDHHELTSNIHRHSVDIKSESPRSQPDSLRIIMAGKQ
ncbi:hypothetical protein AC579_85 [Pseudocercospora musae]|uniref:MARVEL domain-containing protein n=1 Tax=Pseudocercospora musae TaxID=113226 RepID=A0A139IHT9_9PEZI|nr:hypothetical protein AC579_85 [Pseudocercospora musae]KXT14126.1 hypothetical protein AC579_85 [Pseudocercospora musae]KXT14127.1 hypothetical protein AC579_85 [Pseudocercospora musae]KXT14130.1 hypothetical protein AC579_85 [Pseudocercospora musae]